MNQQKAAFLRSEFIPLLQKIPSHTPPAWGKMTLQQMIEHFSDSVRIASGKSVFTTVVTPQEHLEKTRAFILSEKPFRENTANRLLPETPLPVRNASLSAAIAELQTELTHFFSVFEDGTLTSTLNPLFGGMNFAENVHLLHKHALHHLRQFPCPPKGKT